jgi:glycosyltransferase involved in cell wall biosynthesis
MSKVSILIPSRNEQFLFQTVEDIFYKAHGDIEVIVVLDGYWPSPLLNEHKNLTLIHRSIDKGMRDGINSAAAIAKGDFLMKLDAHCMLAEGFDEELKKNCEKHWVVVPRRYSLDVDRWDTFSDKAPVDYHYLAYPWAKPDEVGMHGEVWKQRALDRKDIMVDDEMSSQGSCWFMTKKHFNQVLGGLSEVGYGRFVQEFQEIGLKTWLGHHDGRVVINKNTWYAHLHKGKRFGRGYFIDKREMVRGAVYSAEYWMQNKWEKRVHDIEWLIDKFSPVPTWPENWGAVLENKRKELSTNGSHS